MSKTLWRKSLHTIEFNASEDSLYTTYLKISEVLLFTEEYCWDLLSKLDSCHLLCKLEHLWFFPLYCRFSIFIMYLLNIEEIHISSGNSVTLTHLNSHKFHLQMNKTHLELLSCRPNIIQMLITFWCGIWPIYSQVSVMVLLAQRLFAMWRIVRMRAHL